MIFEEKPITIEENYDRMMPHISDQDKAVLRKIRLLLKQLSMLYGYGYSETIYQKLIAVELEYLGIEFQSELNIPAIFEGKIIGKQVTPLILIENKFLLYIRANIDGLNTYDFLTTRTFLDELELKIGWVINFGKDNIQIQATASKANEYPYL